jgi:hypothetical protein
MCLNRPKSGHGEGRGEDLRRSADLTSLSSGPPGVSELKALRDELWWSREQAIELRRRGHAREALAQQRISARIAARIELLEAALG